MDYSEQIELREPVLTFEHAEKVWGKSFWALDGYRTLLYVRRLGYRKSKPSLMGLWDHRMKFGPISTRNVCYIKHAELGEIPKAITDTYIPDDIEWPDYYDASKLEEYILKKSWVTLFFEWKTMNIDPEVFNTLLYKFLLIADHTKIGMALLNTNDLYVNVNPVDFQKKYNQSYPIEALVKQKEKYDNWLKYAGFNQYFLVTDRNEFVSTPWYYRLPRLNASELDPVHTQEIPEYIPHPLKTSNGIYYPNGYEPE